MKRIKMSHSLSRLYQALIASSNCKCFQHNSSKSGCSWYWAKRHCQYARPGPSVRASGVPASAALDGVAVGAVVEAAEPNETAELVDELVDEIEPAVVVAVSLIAETKPVEAAKLDETELDVPVVAVGSVAETGIGPA